MGQREGGALKSVGEFEALLFATFVWEGFMRLLMLFAF
jgi:hypothetical protein